MLDHSQVKVSRLLIHLVWALSLAVGTPSACAQEEPVPGKQQVSPELIEVARKAAEANTELDDTARSKILELYAKAIQELKDEGSSKTQLAKLQNEVETVGEVLTKKREELEAGSPEIEEPARRDDLAKVQQRLTAFEEQLRIAEKEKAELTEKLARRVKRRSEVPAELEEAKKTLASVDAELDADPPTGESPPLTAAKRAMLLSRQRSVKAKIALLEREIPAYDATAPLLTTEIDLAVRRVSQTRKAVSDWQRFVNDRRRSEAENNEREAKELVKSVAKPAKPLAAEVEALAKDLVPKRLKLAGDIATTLAETRRIERDTARLKTEFDEIKERATVAGFTNALGILLRKQRTALPSVKDMKAEVRERQRDLSETHIKRIEYQNQRSAVSDVETLVDSFVEKERRGLTEPELARLTADVRSILQAKIRYLDGVINDLGSYVERLATLDTRQRSLIVQTEEQAEFIAAHVLWVRSTTPVDRHSIQDAGSTGVWLGQQVPVIAGCLTADALTNPFLWLITTLAVVALVVLQRRMRRRLHFTAELATKRNTTSAKPTLEALGLTALIALALPAVLGFLGWRLLQDPTSSRVCLAAGAGFRGSAILLFTLDMFRHSCRTDGLGIAHFGWHQRNIVAVRRPLRLILMVVVPLSFLVLLLEQTDVDLHRVSLGRCALIIGLVVTAYSVHCILRPINFAGVSGKPGWIRRFRIAWYAFGVGVPLLLAVLAALGYLYSARQLAWRLVESGWLLLVVVLLASLLRRWQLLTYRALAIQQARRRREEALQTDEKSAGEVAASAFEDQAVTLSDSNQKLEKLQSILFAAVTVIGLVVVWNDVLPAFGFLGNVQLWESGIASEVIDGVDTYEWVTLEEVLLAVGVFLLTLFAARNLPGLLEFAVLQRLPVDAGVKYASSSVLRYMIMTVGVVLTFRVIGVGWSNVQWLVAAMTVGLGFGLQEIFANFVSGLILLFERPIRVGDTVTVGQVTGTVTRIRIRATTLVDWDRKELVVPNREFVTGQLVNWTLSDTVLRVIIKVGVAYGSDTRLATELLYRVAAENPTVLNEPEPMVVFDNFGESSLDFHLRCFVGTLHAYRTISHELNLAIDDLFKQHNIEIAFPQRDLHIRSIESRLVVEGDTSQGSSADLLGARVER